MSAQVTRSPNAFAKRTLKCCDRIGAASRSAPAMALRIAKLAANIDRTATRTSPVMRVIVLVLASLLQPLAIADVTAHGPGGFVSEWTFAISAPRERVFRALTEEVGHWWDPAHSYSHD